MTVPAVPAIAVGGPGTRPGVARFVVLAATFVCAACGLVYELALVTLGSYLIGNTIQQASVVLGVMVFAMGIGSLAAKRLSRVPVPAFVVIEGVLAVAGGLSVLVLYAAFAWLNVYQPALVAVALVVGGLIGAEIPVLVTLVQRIRAQSAGETVADLFAADYIGALVGGLAFPFLLLPRFGQLQGALAVGVLNVAAATVVAVVFRRELRRRGRALVAVVLVAALGVLAAAAALAGPIEVSARQALYDDPIVHAERTPYQDIVLTESLGLSAPPDLRLFLNGDLQFSSLDEYRYHEALVHPAMAGRRSKVAILGGGDGLALREVLRYLDVERVVQVELDPSMVRLARHDDRLRRLNGEAMRDPRVEVVTEDAFSWLRRQGESFDVVIADLPDADQAATAKLYSVEFYGLAARALSADGRLVVQAGSPYFSREAFWCVERTLAEARLASTPYQAEVPSFGTWGFFLAGRQGPVRPELATEMRGRLRYLDDSVLAAAAVFPPDRDRVLVEASTLARPRILDYARRGWRAY